MSLLPALYPAVHIDPFTAGSVGITRPQVMGTYANSFGGFRAARPFEYDRWMYLVMAHEPSSATPSHSVPAVSGMYFRLFDDLTSAERTAGKTDYRAVILENVDGAAAASTVNMWLTQPRSAVGTISVGLEAIAADGSIQRIPNETTAPSGVVFSSPSFGSPLALGNIAVNGRVAIWIRRVHTAGVPAYGYDLFKMHFQAAGGLEYTFGTFYSRLSGSLATVTLTGANDGKIITMNGETYTLLCENSSGTDVDAPGDFVYCYDATTFYDLILQQGLPADRTFPAHTGMEIWRSTKTATGIYQVKWKPRRPGHHHLIFDLGGETTVERSVEVSVIGDAA